MDTPLQEAVEKLMAADLKIVELDKSLKKSRQTPCGWCVSTTSTIESQEALIEAIYDILSYDDTTEEEKIIKIWEIKNHG